MYRIWILVTRFLKITTAEQVIANHFFFLIIIISNAEVFLQIEITPFLNLFSEVIAGNPGAKGVLKGFMIMLTLTWLSGHLPPNRAQVVVHGCAIAKAN